jgi:hypothetical protein
MSSIETMVVRWTTKLEVLSDLKHLGSMEEPKGESKQVAQFVYTSLQNQMIRMHDDRGSYLQICCDEMQLMSPFAIDAKGGERFRWKHELLSSMTKGEIVVVDYH